MSFLLWHVYKNLSFGPSRLLSTEAGTKNEEVPNSGLISFENEKVRQNFGLKIIRSQAGQMFGPDFKLCYLGQIGGQDF